MAESYEQALAAVSEGFCPDHLTPLECDGWCTPCRAWHSIDHDPDPDVGGPAVVTSYPQMWSP